MPRLHTLRSLAAAAVLSVLVTLPFAVAQGNDPVLIELGAQRERASDVLLRFDIAVRGMAASQGFPVDDALLEQVYPFLANFMQQRATEIVLLDQARMRGLVVDEAVVEAVIAQARAQFPDDEAFLAVLTGAGFRDVAQLESVVRETELLDALVVAIEAEIVLSELEVRVAYEAIKPRLAQPEQVCARHILVDSEPAAAALSRAAIAGADFAAMAATASTDRGSAANGGDLGCFPMGMMVPEFEAAAFGAEVGVATGAVRSAFGYHVILVERRLPSRSTPLEEVRTLLEQQLVAERVDATIEAYVAASGVRTYPDRIPPLSALLERDD